MKVTLGPYRSWIGPYQIASGIFFWVDRRGIFAEDPPIYNRWDYKAEEKLGDWLNERQWLVDLCNWIDSKKNRKIKIQIDPYDTWSMDHTLAMIIYPMLVQLKNTNHGYFSTDPEDAPGIGVETDDPEEDASFNHDRYNFIMDEMIWTFEQLKSDGNEFDLFYENGNWDFEGRAKYEERIKNGLRLFGKYYRGLWD